MSSWLYTLLTYLKRMGCVLMKQSRYVEGEKYVVKKQLAEGGFSTIELAENSRSRRLVAIKRITCHSIQDQNLAKFEIEVHKKFAHENIIRLLGSQIEGEADIVHNKTSQASLVLPYFPRGSLHDELIRRSLNSDYMEEEFILEIFVKVCYGLRELHKADPVLAHRDIKPHNILLEKDLNPVLMDLGSVAPARVSIRNSRDAQFLQDTAAERCSLTYRPPELYMVPSNCDITERTDIWSLGCLLYAMMYFKSPFDSVYERGDSVALAVQSGKISFPKLDTNYSQSIQLLVNKMSNLDPDFRPSIDNVIEDVEELLAKTSGPSPTISIHMS